MIKEKLHKKSVSLGIFILFLQIFLVAFHQLEHHHDNSAATHECVLCNFSYHNNYIEPSLSFEFKTIEASEFHELVTLELEKKHTSKPSGTLSLRGPPSFFI